MSSASDGFIKIKTTTNKRRKVDAATQPLPTSNKFDALSSDEADSDNNSVMDTTVSGPGNTGVQKLKFFPPIVMFSQFRNHTEMLNKLKPRLKGPLEFKAKRDRILVYVTNKEDFTFFSEYLRTANIEFHTYSTKEDKGPRYVVHLPHHVTTEEIQEDLRAKGLPTQKVIQFASKNKDGVIQTAFPTFGIYFEKDVQPTNVLAVKSILYCRVQWEKFKSNSKALRCYRCQAFDHMASNCNRIEKCSKCSGRHDSRKCLVDVTTSSLTKCANCGDKHGAFDKACPFYTAHIERRQRRVFNSSSNAPRNLPPSLSERHFPSLPTQQSRGSSHPQPAPTWTSDAPKFGEPIANITVAVGREAILTCLVEDLGAYKVAWLRVDTQTILTIHGHVITKNHRIGVTHSDHRNWYLHIKDVRQSDRGWYMCQINTDPMKSQVGFLDIVVPPDILDYGTSTDIVVREGSNVTFNCAASGSPAPNITWRREGGESISVPNGQEVTSVEGSQLSLTKISRLHMGAYLCIASNGVPPSVSKRIMLLVHFPPMIWIQNQLVGSMEGEKMTLECHSEAFPKSINYWTRESGELISQGPKFEAANLENSYKVHMKLTIQSVSATDYGSYKCVSKNSLGDTDGTIKLYHIPTPTTTIATTVTTEEITTTTKVVPKVKPEKKRPKERKKQQQHQAVNQVNDIAHAPEVRDEIQIAQTDRVKVEENRSETKMDRSHFPASGASSQMRRLKTGGSLLYHFLWISAAPSALSLLISNFHLVGVRQQVL